MNKDFLNGFEKAAAKLPVTKAPKPGAVSKFISSAGKSLQETGAEWSGKGQPYWKKALSSGVHDTGEWIKQNPLKSGAIGTGAAGLTAYNVFAPKDRR